MTYTLHIAVDGEHKATARNFDDKALAGQCLHFHGGGYNESQTANAMEMVRQLHDTGEYKRTVKGKRFVITLENEVTDNV